MVGMLKDYKKLNQEIDNWINFSMKDEASRPMIFRCLFIFFAMATLTFSSCRSSFKPCENYISKDDKSQIVDSLSFDLSTNSFVLKGSIPWDLLVFKGEVEYLRNNKFILHERKYLIHNVISKDNLSPNQMELIVNIEDPFIDMSIPVSFPIEVHLNNDYYGFVNIGTVTDTIKLSNVNANDQITINRGSRLIYNEVNFSASDFIGKQLCVSLLPVKEFNRDYMKFKFKKGCLLNKSGVVFECVHK